MKGTWNHLSRPPSIPIAIKQAQLSSAHDINVQLIPTSMPERKIQSTFNHFSNYLILSSYLALRWPYTS